MAYAAPLGRVVSSEFRGSPGGSTVGRPLTVLGIGVCIGTLLRRLGDAGTTRTCRDAQLLCAGSATISLPDGGQAERPDPGDLIEPGGLMGLGLLASRALPTDWSSRSAAALDGTRRPSAARDSSFPCATAVTAAAPSREGGARPGATWSVPAAVPAVSAGRLGVVEVEDLLARRSAPGPRGPGHYLRPDPRAPPTRSLSADPLRRPEPEAPNDPEGSHAAGARTGADAGARQGESCRGLVEDLVLEPAEELVAVLEVLALVVDDVPVRRNPRRSSPSRDAVMTIVCCPRPCAGRVPGAGVPHGGNRARGGSRALWLAPSARTESTADVAY